MKKQEKKLHLPGTHGIQVRSFVTSLVRDEQKEIKGGSGKEQRCTEVPIFC